ncbi:hypothetical protein [Halopiger djelfimassiliensis]|uniref:hypothetical protein n=1 Tax=Halopiger djelfimassiliensis TaxID=1293047 RepID=UPI0006777CF6|nr:hypothetical protein [Halopiger djelfimassiliensis]
MRRIYESDALRRDDEPFTPHERESSVRPQLLRSVNSTGLSRLLVPSGLGQQAISIEITTPRTEYPAGVTIPFTVTMRNPMPVPITIPTNSPLLWTWSVDGATEATRVSLRDPPDEPGEFVFDRGERKRFGKRWDQRFRVSETEWVPAEPGTYTIAAELNVDAPAEAGLRGETTVRIVPDSDFEDDPDVTAAPDA